MGQSELWRRPDAPAVRQSARASFTGVCRVVFSHASSSPPGRIYKTDMTEDVEAWFVHACVCQHLVREDTC